jgi:hypothetical protein
MVLNSMKIETIDWALYSDIDSLMLYAGIHPIRHEFHWMMSKRFPYAIHYSVEKNEVYVCAVLDCRSDPRSIGRRLDNV